MTAPARRGHAGGGGAPSATVERASLVPYRLPLSRPLAGLDERRGLLVVLEAGGVYGVGEVAPWPGLHLAPLEESERGLRLLLPALIGAELPGSGPAPRFPSQLTTEPPEVAWGVATALLDLSAALAGVPLCRLLAPAAPLSVETAALVLGPEDLDDSLARFPAVKVKARSIADVPLLEEARARLGEGELRADGNRALSLEDALALARQAARQKVAFFEEPAPREGLAPLMDAGVPVAFDELLAEPPLPDTAMLLARAAALVLKPSVLGPARTFALLGRPGRKILSSPFESAIGRSRLAHLQAAFSPGVAAGLGTGRYLAEDLASIEDARGVVDLSRRHVLDLSLGEATTQTHG